MSPSSPILPARKRGFTLIELLTVIGIIAILMGLLFPALSTAKNASRKAQARKDGATLVNAVKAYYADYGVYPLVSGSSGNAAAGTNGYDTCYGDPSTSQLYSTADLCDILRAIDDSASSYAHHFNSGNQLNQRQVVYFEGPNATNSTAPRGGFVTNTAGVTAPTGRHIPYQAYVDPWGMEYVVFIDANYDGSLNLNPNGTQSNGNQSIISYFYWSTPIPVINNGVAAVSLGPDNAWGTYVAGQGSGGNGVFQGSDDIATWQ